MSARMDLMAALVAVNACGEAREWLAAERLRNPDATSSRERWDACPRGDWLLWLAARAGVDRPVVVMAACGCARLALHYVPAGEMRPLRCIEVTERWCRGEATIDEVREAQAAAADAAYAAYAADAADAAHLGMRRECADAVRAFIPWANVERGLYLAAGGVL